MRISVALGLVLSLSGCSASLAAPATPATPVALPPPPVTLASAVVEAPLVAPASSVPAEEEAPAVTCEASDGGEGCFASDSLRGWLCARTDPSAAIALFRKGTPWTRAYVARDLESWDPGRRSHKAQLSLDEEVLVLHPYKASGGVVLLGADNANGWTSVDALRSDGTCVSLMSDEIAMKRPLAPKHAPIAWDRLPEHTRAELLASPELRKKAEQVTRACTTAGDPRCTKAKTQLTDAVIAPGG